MYVLGGIESKEEGDHTTSSVLKVDSRTQTWSEVAPMPAERDAAGSCVVGSAIFIFGGRDDPGSDIHYLVLQHRDQHVARADARGQM
jgi:hypothetical protein